MSQLTVHTTQLLDDAPTQLLPEDHNAVIAVYDSHEEAGEAIRELQRAGGDMTTLSLIGKDYHTQENVVGYYSVGDRMRAWGSTGAFWGGIWSLLFGSAFFLVPGIGPLLAAGPVVMWVVAALENAVVVGGISALGAALFSLGIPKDSIIEYETQIKAGKFLVIAHGTREQLETAKAAFETTKHHGVDHYSLLG